MLSAAEGGPSRTPALGIGTAWSGSNRSELLTETVVRGPMRVAVTSGRGPAVAVTAPYVVGGLTESAGYGPALSIAAAAYLLAAVFWIFIPETRGRALT